MVALSPGDLVRLKPNDVYKPEMVQVYQIKDLDHLKRVLNDSEKIVSVSTKPFSGYAIPNICAEYGHIAPNLMGLYLGSVNVEDYGKVFLYYAILVNETVYMIKNDGVELEFGQRELRGVR